MRRDAWQIVVDARNTSITTADALQSQKWPNGVWKVEYSGVVGDAMVFEVRAEARVRDVRRTIEAMVDRSQGAQVRLLSWQLR